MQKTWQTTVAGPSTILTFSKAIDGNRCAEYLDQYGAVWVAVRVAGGVEFSRKS